MIETWARGQYVEVFGLQSQAGRLLNRRKGIVIKTSDDASRIEVCLAPEGKMTSLKPECLRLVPEASAEEMQDAKDVAGPDLRAALESSEQPAPTAQIHDLTDSPEPVRQPERERSRSWSPPPEAVHAASVAGQQASSVAVAQGLSSEQAEALGASAAEQFLAWARANLQKQGGRHQAAVPTPAQAPNVSVSNRAATFEKKPCNSLEDLKVGDSVKAVGLKGAENEMNGEQFVVQSFKGFGGPRSRKYVVSTMRLIINDQGDPAEEKVVLTLPAKNIRLPGDEQPFVDSSDSSDSSSKGKRSKKKSTSKRSRSRRRRGRSSSSKSSTSTKEVKSTVASRERAPPASLSKADRLKKFGFLPQQR